MQAFFKDQLWCNAAWENLRGEVDSEAHILISMVQKETILCKSYRNLTVKCNSKDGSNFKAWKYKIRHTFPS